MFADIGSQGRISDGITRGTKLRALTEPGDCAFEHGSSGGRGIREIGNGKQADPASRIPP